ncbi:hypothetical protein [Nocardia noduli]|uniref:hypothetical protein n=1 Tax=Nocardia noduli TaxID=2815722 RepID=UPI001C239F2D|nr:hypothetical protein [Nocardia noduli]
MSPTEIIALIAFVVLMLQNATQIPHAIAALIRACLPVVHATRDLAAAIENPSSVLADADTDTDLS